MAASMKSLGIDQWSMQDRLQLMDEIVQSLQEIPLQMLSPGQIQELQECVAADDLEPLGGTPWGVVKAELLAELDANATDHHDESETAHSTSDKMV